MTYTFLDVTDSNRAALENQKSAIFVTRKQDAEEIVRKLNGAIVGPNYYSWNKMDFGYWQGYFAIVEEVPTNQYGEISP